MTDDLRYRVLWEKVVGHARNEALIRQIQTADPRRNRHQRRAWAKLVLLAMRLGILQRVEEGAENLQPGVSPV